MSFQFIISILIENIDIKIFYRDVKFYYANKLSKTNFYLQMNSKDRAHISIYV